MALKTKPFDVAEHLGVDLHGRVKRGEGARRGRGSCGATRRIKTMSSG